MNYGDFCDDSRSEWHKMLEEEKNQDYDDYWDYL